MDTSDSVGAAGRSPGPTDQWWHANAPMLERILALSPAGMAVLDRDLRFVWVNEALERLGGVPRDQRLGKHLRDVLPLLDLRLDAEGIESRTREVLDTGQPLVDHLMRGGTKAHPHRPHAYSLSVFRLHDAANRVLGVSFMVLDVTDRWRARERLALLNEVGAQTGSTLDVMHTAQTLADTSVPRLADFVAVDLLDSVIRGDTPRPGARRDPPRMRRAGQQSIHAGCPESVAETGQPVSFHPRSPETQCMHDGRSRLEAMPGASISSWFATDPARAAKIHEFGYCSLILVPILALGDVLGVVRFIRWQLRDPFEQDDLLLAEEVVARAAVSIDNARRYTRQHSTALALQRSLLPRSLTGGSTLDVAWRYLPAHASDGAGGDWCDVIPLSGARVAMVVGDVVGHGIDAAATMGRLRTTVRTLADIDLPPEELLAHLDDQVLRLIDEEQTADPSLTPAALGATCLYVVYDPATRKCTMSRAGHPPAAVITPDGSVTFPDLPAGPPLGLGALPFESAEFEVPDDSVLALYTDGLIATRDQDIGLGLDRLRTALASPEVRLDELCGTVLDAVLTGRPDDDVALLLARTHALNEDQVATWELASDPSVVADARSLTADRLTAWGLDSLLFTFELIVSELVTNAVRYGNGRIRLRLIRQDTLICEVSDASSSSPRMRHARTTDEGGRGLFLVAQLARRWGTRYTADGKIVWAEEHLPANGTQDRAH
ncbi:SpoIIE family protein phosphatase [Streptomyces sp. G7(2002)]|uniref:SpoIIE family protein phosphatase n=1 Tax=Streptomyces sp. G7(2002) TaxID=2971798 RepID=UPI00237E44CC|nr:SpoIIE family protein phosphatase [Streptomyces sp. G7(2002)]WDT53160.1 SpoIIE family protein phosphatase [Streptomyces sp. G7(2002)]